MIASLQPRPPDPLLKVMRAVREDARTHKIDLGIGVYRDEHGKTPVMRAVKEAEVRLIAEQTTKSYVGQEGDLEFLALLNNLVFGQRDESLVAIQAVGGTGALRLGCDLLRAAGAKRVLLPTPSWPNHPAIIAGAGLEKIEAPFFDIDAQRIDLDRLIAGIQSLSPGDAVILQACCHNPLGADFSLEQWDVLAGAIAARDAVAFIDLAYQGLGDGLESDMEGARRLLARVPQALIAVSGSKTFGLYRERVGALFVKCPPNARPAVASTLNAIARANYSMPPDHGAAIVRTILSDDSLRAMWSTELEAMRVRIVRTRAALALSRANSVPMGVIAAQKGMFSTLPLAPAQIAAMRTEHAIYMTDSARVNVAGLRESDVARFVAALGDVARD